MAADPRGNLMRVWRRQQGIHMDWVERVLRVTNNCARGIRSSARQWIAVSKALVGICLHRVTPMLAHGARQKDNACATLSDFLRVFASKAALGLYSVVFAWLVPFAVADAQAICPAGEVITYEAAGVSDSSWSSTCNNTSSASNVLGKYYPSAASAGAAMAAACNGSMWGNQVSWGALFPTPGIGGTEWIMPASFNGGPSYNNGWIEAACQRGYFIAIPPTTAAPAPLPAAGSTCSSCKTGAVHVGHPVDPGSGNEFESALDFQAGDPRLRFTRVYNSSAVSFSPLGWHWQHNFSGNITSAFSAFQSTATISGYVSGIYASASDACNQGWASIQAASAKLTPATICATASFDAATNTCQLSTGQSLPVYSTTSLSTDVLKATTFPALMTVYRPDGAVYVFQCTNGVCTPNADVPLKLTPTTTGYTLINEDGNTETYSTSGALQSITDNTGYQQLLFYDNSGNLVTVTDSKGRALGFAYSSGYLTALTLPDGGQVKYGYDSANRLSTVTYPDGSKITYQYGPTSQSTLVTSVVDEANQTYASFTYDSSGRATGDSLAGGVDAVSITYNDDGNPSVTDVYGITRTYQYQLIEGRPKISALQGAPCFNCGTGASSTYDNNGYPASTTDFNSNVTATTYNPAGLLTQRIEAKGTTAQRTTNFTWNTVLRAPLTRVVLDANGINVGNTQWVYNSTGQTLARCEVDPSNSATSGYTCSNTGTVPAGVRRWTYAYCTAVDTTQCPIVGLMLTATGPRTDTPQTTFYSYYLASSAVNCGTPGSACYQAGDLHTVTDPSGHVTTIVSYDGAGRITRLTDSNGVNTDMTYTPRGWLASHSVGGATTSFTYMPYGAVQTVTDPDGITTTYGYDPAHRLVNITDAQGNYIQYTLDAAGNKTAEQIYDGTGTLHKSLTRSVNALGQLTQVMDGLNHTIFDANGNLVQSADGLRVLRQQSYDALNRLVQTIDNYNGTN